MRKLILILLTFATLCPAQNVWFNANSLLAQGGVQPVLNLPLCGNSPCGGTPTSSTTALDVSGNGYSFTWNGTAAGSVSGTYYSSVSGWVYPYAGYFNGSNNYLTIANTAALKPSFPFTLCAEGVYVTAYPSTSETIYSSDNQTNWAGFILQLNPSGTIGASVGNNTGTGQGNRNTLSTTASVPLSTLTNVCAVFTSATSIQVYFNGAQKTGSASGTGGSMVYTTNASTVGKALPTTNIYFSGIIGRIKLFAAAVPGG